MAHFAEVDSNNIVTRILNVPNEEEHRGQEYLSADLELGGRWIQTSYNNNIRYMYAGIGYIYDEEYDIFLPPKPYPSWILNESHEGWIAPVPKSDDPTKVYGWNEENQEWYELPVAPTL